MLRSLLLVPFLLAAPAGAAPPPQQPAPPSQAPSPAMAPTPAPEPQVAPLPPAAAAATAQPSTDSVRRVPIAEAQEALKSGKAVIVDVRSAADYQASHAHGALSIPLAEVEQRSKELPREKFIITYCT